MKLKELLKKALCKYWHRITNSHVFYYIRTDLEHWDGEWEHIKVYTCKCGDNQFSWSSNVEAS